MVENDLFHMNLHYFEVIFINFKYLIQKCILSLQFR